MSYRRTPKGKSPPRKFNFQTTPKKQGIMKKGTENRAPNLPMDDDEFKRKHGIHKNFEKKTVDFFGKK